jgi:hypothetical protein
MLMDATHLPDGTILPLPERRLLCARCREVPEFIIEVVRPIEEDAGADLARRSEGSGPLQVQPANNHGALHQ